MDEGGSSVHSKSWTIEDLRTASTNWNLNGDRALLDILESVHNNIVEHSKHTASKLHNLNTELCRTSVSLKNVNNRFMGLSNTQFMESSVQEDDVEIIKVDQRSKDELIIPQSNPTKSKDAEEAERREALMQSVSKSCSVLEGLCERLDISPDSDSESDSSPEDTAQSVVLRPKDSYSETPLPYIIGSHKWQKKWHIGLHDCSSDSESDDDAKLKLTDQEARYSSSEESQHEHVERSRDERVAERKSQMSLPIPQKQPSDGNRSSMTSTSTNNSSDATDQEVAKINANLKTPLDGGDSQENLDRVDSGQKKVPNASDFAAELARKLGGNVHSNVTSTKNDTGKSSGRSGKGDAKTVTTNKNKEGKSSGFDPMLRNEPAKRVTGNIFSDEPPPLDIDPYADTDDLFGDNDDDDSGLFSSKPSSKPNPSKTFQSTGLFGNKQSSNYGGLFDDLPDENDSDDFDSRPKQTQSKSKNSDMSDKNRLTGKQTQSKNKNSGLFDASDEDVKPKTKTKGFFDDSDDEFFSSEVPQSKKTDDIKNATQSKKGLFDSSAEHSLKNKDLFDDSTDDFDSSFEVTKKDVASKEVKQNVKKGLFDDDDSDLFGGNAVSKKESKVAEKAKKVGGVIEDQKKGVKKLHLFGDDDSDDDGDLFASLKKNATNKPAIVPSAHKNQVLEQKIDKVDPKQQATNLFGETIDTEPEDLFAPMKMPPKKLPEVKKEKVLKLPDDKAVKEAALPNKPPEAVSMFGDNPNILHGPNSSASSILTKRRKDSSSSESDKDQFKGTFEKVGKRAGFVHQTQSSRGSGENKVNVLEKPKALDKKTLDNSAKASEILKKEQHEKSDVKKEEIFEKIKVDKSKQEVKNKIEQKVKDVPSTSNVLDNPIKSGQNLFEDVDDDLFGPKKVVVGEKVVPVKAQKRSSSLFDDVPPPLDDEIPVPEGPRDVNSLFDYDDDEDLFSTIRNITKTSKNTISSGLFDDLPAPVEEIRETKQSSNVGLFSDEPPDLDDKDEPVGDSDMFSDYPYYKSVNIIKNNTLEKVVDQAFVGGRDSLTVEENEKVKTESDEEEKVLEKEKLHQKSAEVKSILTESKTVSTKSAFDELSNDDGDLFSSLAKAETSKESASNKISGLFADVIEDFVPNANQETEDKTLFEVRTDSSLKVTMDLADKSKASEDNINEDLLPKKEEENKKLFEVRIDPSLKVTMDLSDNSKGLKGNVEEISSEYEASGSTPTLVEKPDIVLKPDIVMEKPEIKKIKPEISHVKPNIVIPKPKMEAPSDKSNYVDQKSNAVDSKPDIKHTKPEISNMKPNIETKKPEIINAKPNIVTKKPKENFESYKQESIKETKQDIVASKPEINARKPEIISSKPENSSKKPEFSSPIPIEINSTDSKPPMSDIFEAKSPSISDVTDFDASNRDLFADNKNKLKLKPEVKHIKPVISKEMSKESILHIQNEVSTEDIIKTSVSELVSRAENDPPKEIFREEANIVSSSSIGDIKAALSKKSKSSLDMSEEIDGGFQSSMKKSSKSENASPTKTVGKLTQSSLNINVKALIPGAAPKLVKEINEERKGIESITINPENSKSEEDINYESKDSDPGNLIGIGQERNGNQPSIISHSRGLEAIKSVSFDEDPKSLDSVLSNSLSKDRVKIRAKRRPSTRKARHEAVRKSTADIVSFDETDYADMDYTSSLPTSPYDKRILDVDSNTDRSDFSSSLQSSFNDEDTIQTIGKVYREREIKKNYHSDFGKDVKKDFVSKVDDSLKEVSKVEVKTKKTVVGETKKADDLFNIFKAETTEEEVGDDLFGSIKPNAGISEPFKKVDKVSEAKSKKSLGLFGETDEENDLFPNNGIKKKTSTALFSDDSNEDLFSSLKPKETDKPVKAKNSAPESVKPKEAVVKAKKDSVESVKSQGAIRKIATTKSVFNDSDSDSDLFSSKSTATDQRAKSKAKGKSSDSRKQTDKSRNKLFGDSDSEDELFFKPVIQGKAIGGHRDKTKLLFDDNDDGDIFKTDKGAVKKTVLPSSRTQVKTQNVILSSAEIATQDPLSSFFDA